MSYASLTLYSRDQNKTSSSTFPLTHFVSKWKCERRKFPPVEWKSNRFDGLYHSLVVAFDPHEHLDLFRRLWVTSFFHFSSLFLQLSLDPMKQRKIEKQISFDEEKEKLRVLSSLFSSISIENWSNIIKNLFFFLSRL